MKYTALILVLFIFININAQEKDNNGISINAPKGVHQYAFRIGEWDGASKDLLALNKWKTNSGKHRFYVAENGLTFIEEGIDEEGKLIHKITYDYIESTDSWENNYTEIATGKKVKYTSKFVNGIMTETIKNERSIDSTKYTIVAPNVFIYTSERTYSNGFKIVTHVSVSTKEVVSKKAKKVSFESGNYKGLWNSSTTNRTFTDLSISASIKEVAPGQYTGSFFISNNFTSCCNSGDNDGVISFNIKENILSIMT